MTDDERREAYIHIEDALKSCYFMCDHQGRRDESMAAYNAIIKLGNDEFKDMDEYRRKFNDPTS